MNMIQKLTTIKKKNTKSVCLGPKPYENGKLCAISQAGRLRIQKTTFSLSGNSIPLLLFPIQKTAKYPHGTSWHPNSQGAGPRTEPMMKKCQVQ